MPIVDKTGQKFGHLTVLRKSEKRNPKNNKILWECQCDCGNPEIVYATTGNLTQGYKTSCGCAKKQQLKELAKQNTKNLINQKFGYLTVLYQIEGVSPPMWYCRCDCGTELAVSSTALLRKEKTSCGCQHKELRKNLIGKRFGKLVVVNRAKNYISPSGQSQIRYECNCDCGNIVTVMATSLTQGLVHSCGCLRSMGEMIVENYLRELNINFQREYRFEQCRDKKPLPFDFCIFDKQNNLKFLIEINGKQHYQPIITDNPEDGYKAFEKQQQHDFIKKIFCQQNGYDLLIIPYYNLNNFKEIINERLQKYEL